MKQSRMERILEQVKRSTRPDLRILHIVDETVAIINAQLARAGISAICVKGGSTAKETFLKNNHDIDLFVRFNTAYRGKDISRITHDVLQACKIKGMTPLLRIHGSRDYFQCTQQIIFQKQKIALQYEIVPVLLIHAQDYQDAENVTDLSPEHVNWVNTYTAKNPGLKDEIRLAKQFCKANGVYGAESYINGFSGHILDILIIHYGSFTKFAVAFAKITPQDMPIIIDHEKHLKNPLKELNESKITPLIIVDPIQADRNAAAALSKEKLEMFITACKKFLDQPDKKFFQITPFNLKREIAATLRRIKTAKKITHLQTDVITIKTLDGSKDIVGTKVLKVYELLTRHLTLEGFVILGAGWNFAFEKRSAVIYMITAKESLPAKIEMQGPPVRITADYNRFVEKHRAQGEAVSIRGDHAIAIIKRKYTTPAQYLSELFRKDFIASRVAEIKIHK